MNYTALVKTIKSYVENDFPDTLGASGLTTAEQVDTFIEQAEQRVYNTVQILNLRKNVTGPVTVGNQYLTVPSDWLATHSMAVKDVTTGAYSFLDNKDVSYIREAFPNPTSTGKPTHFAMFDDDTFFLAPAPDLAYEIELHYFYYPTSIVTASTTWLGDNFDSVLLYGALLEAYTFMKGEVDVIAEYQKRYDEALTMLKQLSEGKNRQDNHRTKQTRYPVQ